MGAVVGSADKEDGAALSSTPDGAGEMDGAELTSKALVGVPVGTAAINTCSVGVAVFGVSVGVLVVGADGAAVVGVLVGDDSPFSEGHVKIRRL